MVSFKRFKIRVKYACFKKLRIKCFAKGRQSDWPQIKIMIDSFKSFKVAYTSGPIFEKIMKRYPIFSVQIINYQIDQMHK